MTISLKTCPTNKPDTFQEVPIMNPITKRFPVLLLALLLLTLPLSAALADGALPIDLSGGAPYTVKYSSDLKVYEDPTIRVERDKVVSPAKEFNCTYYYAIVTIQDASQLRTVPADNKDFVSNHRTPGPNMAKRVNAIIAINGDFPNTFNGNVSNTYVLRQGEIYRDSVEPTLDLLLIDEDGDFHVIPAGPEQETMDKTEVDGKRVINAFQFGPALIIDGEPVPDEVIHDRAHSPAWARPDAQGQRMCIGQIGPLQYLVVCCAHYGSNLATMREIALTIAPDCQTLYTLDGGESAQMMFLGRKINNINEDGNKPRKISDLIYFASADFH